MPELTALVPICEIVKPLTLIDLSRICGSSADWVIELEDEGILDLQGEGRAVWRFESTSITTVRKVQRLQRDLRLNMPGVPVVLSLADENAALKRRLQMLENDPRYAIWMHGPEGFTD